MTFLVSIGNFGVHLPETTALVFWTPSAQTSLIAKILVGKKNLDVTKKILDIFNKNVKIIKVE